MARFGINEAAEFSKGGDAKFFSLQNNGDVAKVRFCYNTIEDIEGFSAHELRIDDNHRLLVNCLRERPSDPKSVCPFCANGNIARIKYFVPLYDEASGEVKLWERGKKFGDKLQAICNRYAKEGHNLIARTFEIERHGERGDTQTTYEIFPGDADVPGKEMKLEELELPEILGPVILDKTAEEMEYYLANQSFEGSSNTPAPADAPTGRRTPATSRRGGDSF